MSTLNAARDLPPVAPGGRDRGGQGARSHERRPPHQERQPQKEPVRASEPTPRAPRETNEDTDGSHLPAFLLRPVPIKA